MGKNLGQLEDESKLKKAFNEWVDFKKPNSYQSIYLYLNRREIKDETNQLKSYKEFMNWAETNRAIFDEKVSPLVDSFNWKFASSKGFTGEKKHRLYLDTACQDTALVAKKFIEQCKTQNLQFYLKFAHESTRSDSMIIYSTDSTFENYYKILEDIRKNNPEIVSRSGNLPLASSPLNEWIGYGVEDKSSSKGSLTKRTSVALHKAFEKTLLDNMDKVDVSKIDVNTIIENYLNNGMDSFTRMTYGKNSDKYKELYNTLVKNKSVINDRLRNLKISDQDIDNNSTKLSFEISGIKYDIKTSHIAGMLRSQFSEIISSVGGKNLFEQLQNNCRSAISKEGLNLELPESIKKIVENNSIESNAQNRAKGNEIDVKYYPQFDFSFDGLKNTFEGYDLRKNRNGQEEVIDKKTGIIIADPLVMSKVKFAQSWFEVNNFKSTGGGDDSLQREYSFNDGAEKTYNYMMKTIKNQMKQNGNMDISSLVNGSFDMTKYKYSRDILHNLTSDNKRFETLKEYFGQADKYIGLTPDVKEKIQNSYNSMLNDKIETEPRNQFISSLKQQTSSSPIRTNSYQNIENRQKQNSYDAR